ncbi:aldehyde dehydrogenase [Aestuariispira ectoiniformans]|uniref:aldehyde dehydrogenase n=1 Tax=Aestuariispira ectoiniformans TaxID=2775080 RepID=UPI00223C337A|nr:aldehyde dehydrogenase [Aestuariispira ectoiniformans]
MGVTISHDEWKARAAALKINGQAFVGGKHYAAQSGETFDCINPATGEVLTQVTACGQADIDHAVQVARAAFNDGRWSRMLPKKRKKILIRFAELMEKHGEELALLETLDMGKPIGDSTTVDIPLSVEAIAWFGEAIDKVNDEVAPTMPNALSLITREPVGVVAAIVPWNFPLMMACWKLGPALATGNSVILKPAEQSPLTALRIAELAAEAGLPDGVLNVLPGFGSTAGKALGLHMDVDMIAFTGSGEVGKLLLQYSGQSNMKRVALECGGKSPHIVMGDCPDLDRAAKSAAFGIFFNQGEVCTAGSRLLVQESIKDELLEKVVDWGKKLQPGDPLNPSTQMGAIVEERQMDKILSYIDIGQQEGAQLKLGGNRALTETGGYYVEPTIFDSVNNKMRIAQEEIFGPVLSTITFKTPEEAVAIGNDTIYGLAAAVWTRDIDVAHRTAAALRAGSVWVNTYDAGDISLPFGGYKQSGFGRDKSLHAIDKYTELKATWFQLS